jgi:uncharacterized Zn finger protein
MPKKTGFVSASGIRDHVGDQSFERGERYANNGYISNLRKSGNTLKGISEGSSGGPYRVKVTVEDGAIVGSECSCPIGGGCKHVAALLLAYLHDPVAAEEVEDGSKTLDKRSKPQLIELIELMVERHPDLEDLLDMPLATDENVVADPKPYQRQAQSAFASASGEWGYQRGVARQLGQIMKTASKLQAQGKMERAAAAFEGILAAILANEDDLMNDESGDLGSAVSDCVEELDACLQHLPPEDKQRQRIIGLFVELAFKDIEMGGIGLADEARDCLRKSATPQEKRAIAQQIEQALRQRGGDSFSSEWRRQALGSWLLDMQKDSLDDAAYLRICRETGRIDDLVSRLLELKRVDEAVAECQRVKSNYELSRLAEVFAQHKQADRIEPVLIQHVQADATAVHADTLIGWLRERCQKRGDIQGALEWTLKLFKAHPSLEEYRHVRTLANKLKTWASVRETLLAGLKRGNDNTLIIRIYLEEKDVGAAIAALKARSSGPFFFGVFENEDVRIRVAKAAEGDYPDEAIAIYLSVAEQMIEQRNRGAYAAACDYLVKAGKLFARQGRQAEWRTYLANLVDTTKTLRALREEMGKVGLLK